MRKQRVDSLHADHRSLIYQAHADAVGVHMPQVDVSIAASVPRVLSRRRHAVFCNLHDTDC